MSSMSAGSLFRSSWSVFRSDSRIFKAQLLGLVLTTLTAVGVGAVVLLTSEFSISGDEAVFEPSAVSYALLVALSFGVAFIGQVVQAFVVLFSLAKFRGEEKTYADVKAQVIQNLKGILLFTALSTTIGLVLRAIEERVPLGGKIATWIAGAAWAVASMFAIAVIADRGRTNPLEATKESAGIVKKTFGPNVRVNLGLGIVGALSVIGVIFSGIAVSVLLAAMYAPLAIAGGVITFIALMLVILGLSSLTAIVKAGLYEYANSGNVPAYFSENSLKEGIKQKQARGIFK